MMVDKGLLFFAGAAIFMGGYLLFFERKAVSSKEIVLISVLAAMAALGRVPFAVIPGAQPTTFMIIISGYIFGPMVGFIVGIAAPLVSNIFLGQGPWTIVQMFTWGLCGISAGFLGKIYPHAPRWLLIVFGFFWGYLFGWIMNVWYWLSFIYPLNFKTWIYTYAASFWFDTVHAVTNFIFFYFLGSDFIVILRRFKQKLSYSHQKVFFKSPAPPLAERRGVEDEMFY